MPYPLGEMESTRIYGLEEVYPIKEVYKQLRMALGHERNYLRSLYFDM